MIRWKNFLFNCTLAANCLLCFLLLFEQRLVVPSWLQVAGRMHPLILHFPIVLLVLFSLSSLLRRQDPSPEHSDPSPERPDPSPEHSDPSPEHPHPLFLRPNPSLLLLAAFATAITALMGLVLSKEPGYDPDALFGHKYGGILLSLFCLSWYAGYDRLQKIKFAPLTAALLGLVLLTFASHQGASITHGQNFLLGPVSPETVQKAVALDEAVVFTDMVQPILKTKCISCHNSSKAKGELVMETTALFLKGGKSGALWDSSRADFGLLMQRVHLPIDHEKHMPPKAKPQLTETEITILYQWLKHDPSRSIRVTDLEASDTLRILAQNQFKNTPGEEQYDFSSVDEKKIQQLNTSYRVIYPVALHSPALNVDFFSAPAFTSDQLKELAPLARQIVSLDLHKMPVTDADIPTIVSFSNLRTLHLDFTGVTGAGIAKLCQLQKLKTLSLSGTPIKQDDIGCLTAMPSLRHLYLWNTAIPPENLSRMTTTGDVTRNGNIARNGNLIIEGGSRTDTMLLQLNPPILKNEQLILFSPMALQLKHYVPGTTIRYTLDGSEPDSSNSRLYEGRDTLTAKAILRAKAFKRGWLPSEEIKTWFYSEKYRPDSVRMLLPIDSNYMKFGAKTLIDLTKGDESFGSGKWLGFRKNNMECLLLFPKPILANSVTLSALVNIGSSILPPVYIEVWGGPDAQRLRLLKRMTPDQPGASSPGYLTGYDLSFSPTPVQCLKVIAAPVAKLPDWHPAKGKKGWVFLDEVFVN